MEPLRNEQLNISRGNNAQPAQRRDHHLWKHFQTKLRVYAFYHRKKNARFITVFRQKFHTERIPVHVRLKRLLILLQRWNIMILSPITKDWEKGERRLLLLVNTTIISHLIMNITHTIFGLLLLPLLLLPPWFFTTFDFTLRRCYTMLRVHAKLAT